MDDRRANLVAFLSVLVLVLVLVVSRVVLGLSEAFYLIAGADAAVILGVFAWLAIRRHYNRRRMVMESRLISEGRELRIEYSFLRKVAGVPTKFRFKEIEEATDNFRAMLGQGASAHVFKGILNDGTAVAVKRMDGQERGDKEFKAEVSAIASVQHTNLARLYGYCCVPDGPRFLVYEFVSNGSLDRWIFTESGTANRPQGCLSWSLRYRAAVDVAKALAYLHHDCRSRVLHLDVKPENILLDESYRAIVSDFGLSRLMGKDESRVLTTIRGTRGYLAPEWLLEQGISEKSDIYSFGMVLLEMVGGRRNVCLIDSGNKNNKADRKWEYFPKIVYEKLKEGRLMEVVDARLLDKGDVDEREVRRAVFVALWCIQEKVRLRPSMAQVVEMLQGRVPVDEPPQTQMIIVDLLSVDDDKGNGDVGNGIRRAPRLAAFEPGNIDRNGPALSYSYAMSTISPR